MPLKRAAQEVQSKGRAVELQTGTNLPIFVISAIVTVLAVSPVSAAGEASSPSEAIFIGAILVILLTSRVLGEAMPRLGQPAVIGHLIAGILLGPSFFGLIWPEMQRTLFSQGERKGLCLVASCCCCF
jgi:hypothetical protein